jgi:hypothetical protein
MAPNWKPLEEKLGRERCVGFMYMGRVNGINLYKHGIARTYLNLDDHGRCYLHRGDSSYAYEATEFEAELAKLEAALTEIGESLESRYDEEYISRKRAALEKAGVRLLRFKIQPQRLSIN